MKTKGNKNIDRREFLKRLGAGAAVSGSAMLVGCDSGKNPVNGESTTAQGPIPKDKMTYRINPKTGDKVSILGYGCMRWPTVTGESAREGEDKIDQEAVNRLVDYAIEHGVNYFDTSPAYCKGHSEEATGIALKRHPRNKFFVATKLSNFDPSTWSREKSIEMYHNSLKLLQVDYIDYMLLHAIGMGDNGMEAYKARYVDNGMLDYLLAEREAGRIRNLGFSYHGDIEVFDYLLSQHDRYKWDFVQIQLNYLDWQHARSLIPATPTRNIFTASFQNGKFRQLSWNLCLAAGFPRCLTISWRDSNSANPIKVRLPGHFVMRELFPMCSRCLAA